MRMGGFRRFFFAFWIAAFMPFALSYGQPRPEPRTQTKPPVSREVPSSRVAVPDEPDIREFTGPDFPVVQGAEITLRWKVEPGPGGSPIARVNIVAPYLPDEMSPPIGERRFVFSGGDFSENRTYRLTATNSAGRSASRTLVVRHILIRDALDQLAVNFRSNPPEFKAGQPIDFEIGLSNREGPPLIGLNISVSQGGRRVGDLSDIRLGHGTAASMQRLRDTGFTGAAGEYVVDVGYRGVHRQIRFRTMSLPYYAIVPVP
jgi:hypothetical protein